MDSWIDKAEWDYMDKWKKTREAELAEYMRSEEGILEQINEEPFEEFIYGDLSYEKLIEAIKELFKE